MKPRGEAGLSALLVVVAGALVGGLAIGAAAGIATAPDPEVVEAPDEVAGTVTRLTVAGLRCPGGAVVATFHDGDRVLATGRDATSTWIEVRDPQNLSARVWIAAGVLDADTEPDLPEPDLPERTCGGTTVTTLPETTTSTPSSTTTTTRPGTTTTTPSPTPTTSSGGPTTTTTTTPGPTTPPDAAPPEITQFAASRTNIIEDDAAVCGTNGLTLTVTGVVTDAVGVASVTARWTVGAKSGTTTVTQSGTSYSATIGPFATDTVPYPTDELPLTITLTAADAAGNQASANTTVTLFDCTFI